MDILIYLLIFLAIALMCLAIFTRPQSREDTSARLRYLQQKRKGGEAEETKGKREVLSQIAQESREQLAPVMARYISPQMALFLRRKLDQAGLYDTPVERYAANQLLGLLLFPAAFLIVNGLVLKYEGVIVASLMTVLMGVGAYYPIIRLNTRLERRRQQIFRAFPDVLDLLTICLEAGMGLDAALNLLVARGPAGPLRAELEKTLAEIRLGKPRVQALRDMAQRLEMREVTSFVVALSQVEQMGGSLAQTLRTQAEIARESRWQRAQEQAQKAPVKLLFPMLLLIFPNIFLIIFGPMLLSYLLGKL